MPQPTPYDIVPIPYFPYTPGPAAWFMLGLLAAVFLAGWFIIPRYLLNRRTQIEAIRFANSELRELKARIATGDKLDKAVLHRLSLLIKRTLSALHQRDLCCLTAAELESLESSLTHPPSRRLTGICRRLDQLRFQDTVDELPQVELIEEVIDLFANFNITAGPK